MARKVRNHPGLQRRKEEKQPSEINRVEAKHIFSAALYIRLSKEDGGKQNQNTAENQQALLMEFAGRQPNMQVYQIYIDM